MPNREEDLRYVETGIQELKDYLLSDVLFWPLTAPLPRLTIGGLLLAQKRLQAQGAGLHLNTQLDAVRNKWRVAWEEKAVREISARFNLWKNYLDDYRTEPQTRAESYAHEIRWRVLLVLLFAELPSVPVEAEGLSVLDTVLQGKFVSGKFIWDAAIKSGFPQDEFWFLYGIPKG